MPCATRRTALSFQADPCRLHFHTGLSVVFPDMTGCSGLGGIEDGPLTWDCGVGFGTTRRSRRRAAR